MAEASQFSFSLKEITEILVRTQGITEGKWSVGFELGLGAANIALGGIGIPNIPSEPRPTGFMQINGVNIMRLIPGTPETGAMVDAASLASQNSLVAASAPKTRRRAKVA